MNILRNIASWISLYLVGTLFFITASVFVFFTVVNPDTIKGALADEKVYDNVVPAVLKTTANTNASTGQLPLTEPWVQTAAEQAFPANDLEQKTNTVIDGTFAWLEGETDKPAFSIDLTSNKAQFSQAVGDYTQTRFENLPACTRANIPTSIDPYTISCKVPGINAASIASSVRKEVDTDPNFLQNPVISSDNASLNPVNQAATQNPFEQLEGLRDVYQNKTLLSWLLPILTIVCAVTGIGLSLNRVAGLKRLARSFGFAALSLLALGLLVGVGFERVIDTFAIDAITSTIVGPVLSNLGRQAQVVYFIFSGIAAVAGIGSYVASRKLRAQPPVNSL